MIFSSLRARPAVRRVAALTSVAVAATGLAALAAASPAAASSVVTGRVHAVYDGDTIGVDIYGDHTPTLQRVRIAGIQAMELSVYSADFSKIRGQCWGKEATVRMSGLVLGKVVRLSARSTSSTSRGRMLRHLDVQNGSGWLDVGQRLLLDGLVIPDVNKVEYTRNRKYLGAGLWAAGVHRGMFGDSDHCGSGPWQSQKLTVWVKWKGGASVNGEYIKITNHGTATVSLAHWWVRDNALRRYTFPTGAVVKPGEAVYVHPGKGTRTAHSFYWGLSSAIFEDASTAPLWLGDGGYLFDPQGDLRGWYQYRAV
jgi:endonuclease YncB( thermonuclease family)